MFSIISKTHKALLLKGITMSYVEIVGTKGSGKTSLLKVFNEHSGFNSIEEKREDLDRIFFKKEILENYDKHVFAGTLNFIAFHLNRIKEGFLSIPKKSDVVVDTAILSQYAYAKPFASKDELRVLSNNIRLSYANLPKVDLRISLSLPIDVQMARIRKRNRPGSSDRTVKKEFIEAANKSMGEAIVKFSGGVKTLHLDGSKLDWVNNEDDKKKIMKMVHANLKKHNLA